ELVVVVTDPVLVPGAWGGPGSARAPELVALDIATGQQRWTVALLDRQPRSCAATLVADDLVLLHTGPSEVGQRSVVRALDLATGVARWTTELDRPLRFNCNHGGLHRTD